MQAIGKTRKRIIEIADQLIYEQGFEHASFARIGEIAGISKGNFYHHFKSKDELLSAVIDYRLQNTRTMLQEWEQEGVSAADRIKCYIRIVLQNWRLIKKHGCPVGTLTNELAKLDHPAKSSAAKVFKLFRTWLGEQFAQIGKHELADSRALHVLSWSQGVATMASAFRDKKFAEQEVETICRWVDEIANTRSN